VRTVEIAEDWLVSKQLRSRASNPVAADRARRDDLSRWGRALATSYGHDTPTGPYDLSGDLAWLDLAQLDSDHVLRSLSLLRERYAASTCQRMLATLRTFSSWCVRRGYMTHDPCDHDDIAVTSIDDTVVFAFSDTDVAALIDAAGRAPLARERVWFPARDVAALRVLADCGLRVAELCALRSVDAAVDADPPMLHVVHGTKGSRRRDVPLPARTIDALAVWQRHRPDPDAEHLLTRNDGTPLTTQFVDRLIRRCAHRAGITMPGHAAAHGFRHHYGVQLAQRGVPLTVIADTMGHRDTRTTSIYTRMVGRELTAALDDAGWL
jgi:site-specific recombinase XerD